MMLCACATPAGQGGAKFTETPAPTLNPEALFAVCWPQDALPSQKVTLTFQSATDVIFEAKDGASNSTARCMREIATSVKWPKLPSTLDVSAPTQPIDGWAVMAWVKLLSPSRFGPERGVVDPGATVAACLNKIGPLRPASRFVVRHTPGFEVRAIPSALADSERCVEAVLNATAWPSARELFFEFASNTGAPTPAGDVSVYTAPSGPSTGAALDPTMVKERLQTASPKVAACWDAALARRTTIGGGRTFRFRVGDDGFVSHAWVTATMSDGATASDLLLDGCLASALKTVHFPPQSGDGVYTWVFASR
ncbi:MAG: hypothetical protein QM817_08265 [Archangium sp.]